jgi:chromosomal replication initiator protein
VHGPAGCGKSCLVNALAEDVSELSLCLRSANDFPLPWDQDEPAAPERYREARSCDLLILEDLQHLPARATEALVQLLDERLRRRLATVVTASAGPAQLSHRGSAMPARLTNRLASGLVVALQPLQAASRLAFLQEMARRRGLDVGDEVLRWLADSLTGGRQLEGALNQLGALRAINGKPLGLPEVQAHFQVQVDASRPTVERIVRRVGDYFRVAPRQLQSARRNRSVVVARQVGMYLTRRLTRLSLQQIGAYFGGRDHTTVLHACRKVEEAMKSDVKLSGAVRQMHAELA